MLPLSKPFYYYSVIPSQGLLTYCMLA